MTWNKFMTYAHQNIERRPIPYIDNPFPGVEEQPAPIASPLVEDNAPQPARPKLLTKQSEDALLALERLLRNAKRLKMPDEVASNSASGQVTQ